MKPNGALALLLSISLPASSFAQTFAASQAAGSATAGVSAAAGAITTVPTALSAVPLLSLSAPSLAPGVLPLTAPALAASERSAVVAVEMMAAVPALPAALSAVIPAAAAASDAPSARTFAAKPEAQAAKTWTEKLAAMFDGGSEKKAADETPLEPGTLKAFVVRHGRPMTEITLAEASTRKGPVRLLTAAKDPQGLSEKHAPAVGALLRDGAVPQNEALSVDWARQNGAVNEAAAAQASARPATLGEKLLWPLREAKFLAKSFRASLVKPLPSEILGGIATKSFPLVTSIGVYWAAVGLAHPLALGGLILLSLTQEVFHGIFLKSWNNFQEIINRERGFNYQMFFNLAYMQGFGTLYRLLSWSANPKSVTPPWSVHYWKDMAVMSVVGTFFGVMGYNSLNQLYNKGAIKRWQHSGIQQLRDLLFLLAGPFFASGSMTVFWSIFLFQQSLDLAIAIWAGRAQAREIVLVTSATVASSLEFQKKYPLQGVPIVSPAKQAVKAVWENPLVRLLTWPARAAWKAVRGGTK